MRKLASIQYVNAVKPILGADAIECIRVLGWELVAKKGEFKVGDKCVYFEIDSFLPVRPEFEFLRRSSYKKSDLMGEGFRLKTMRMRGQLSQGLALPISVLPDKESGNWEIGDEVTDVLGVKKWEIEERVTNFGLTKGEFPSFITKSDETRVQSDPKLLDFIRDVIPKNTRMYISTKMDGSSITIAYYNHEFHVFSRNMELKEEGSTVWSYFKRLDIPVKLAAYCELYNVQVAVQGEFCGPGIQNNRLKLVRPEWYVFTVQRINDDFSGNTRKGLTAIERLCTTLGVKSVPIEETLTVDEFLNKYPSIDSLLDRAKGMYPSGKSKEGIVIRITDKFIDSYGEEHRTFSFKVINNEYLLGG